MLCQTWQANATTALVSEEDVLPESTFLLHHCDSASPNYYFGRPRSTTSNYFFARRSGDIVFSDVLCLVKPRMANSFSTNPLPRL